MIVNDNAETARISVHTGIGTGTSGFVWLFGDHLGSTSRSANYDGAFDCASESRVSSHKFG